MTGVFGMMYGQFFPAWHSRYYPFLMAQNVKMKQILQSAFFLMAVTNIVFYLLSLGYMFITPKVLYIHLAVMLYNIGVNTFVIFALGLNSRKAIDLEQRAMFNYQGMSATNWLITFPYFVWTDGGLWYPDIFTWKYCCLFCSWRTWIAGNYFPPAINRLFHKTIFKTKTYNDCSI